MFNKYGFYNLVYVPVKNSTELDPYSFYYLEQLRNDKRCWKMDCRLEETGNKIISNVKSFLVQIFRKIYLHIFNDNNYRKDYEKIIPAINQELDQLLQNILILSKPISFCNTLRDIVKEIATYIPTEKDKFNLYADDILQRKRYQAKEKFEPYDILCDLFDCISTEEAVDFYRSKQDVMFM